MLFRSLPSAMRMCITRWKPMAHPTAPDWIFRRPRVSNDNPYSESIFRTCKYRPNYPIGGFATINDSRTWVKEFVHWYNYNHHHSGIKFLTPHQRHSGQGEEILKKRHLLYEAAKARHPERWTCQTRNWTLINEVWLNPEKSQVNDIAESETTA